jgi:hypothetical protein
MAVGVGRVLPPSHSPPPRTSNERRRVVAKKKKRHGTSLPLPAVPNTQQSPVRENIPFHPPNMHRVMRTPGTIKK